MHYRILRFFCKASQYIASNAMGFALAIHGSSAHALPAESHGIAHGKTGATEPNARHNLFSAVTR
jgi:hypothetical protein